MNKTRAFLELNQGVIMWWVIEVADRSTDKSAIPNDGMWIMVLLEVLMRFQLAARCWKSRGGIDQ